MAEEPKPVEPLLRDGTAPATPEQVIAALDRLNIENSTISHAPMRTVEDSIELRSGVPGGYSKNLFLRNKKGIMVVVTMLEDRTINLAALGEQLSMGKLSFASPERMMRYLGVIPGAVTPLSVINDKDVVVTAVIDKALLEKNPLHFHPCDNCKTTSLSADGLLKYMTAYHNTPHIIDFDTDKLSQ